MSRSCQTCRWYEAPAALASIGTPGICRQQPPTTVPLLVPHQDGLGRMVPQIQFISAWANVQSRDWCAQHASALELQ